jgi:hypothetical protein
MATQPGRRYGMMRLQPLTHWIGIMLWSGCTLGALSPGDQQRPALGEHDVFSIDPPCLTIPLNQELGLARPHLSVRGRRASGAGAESVPVRFRIGPCPSWTDVTAGAGGAASDAGADRCTGAAHAANEDDAGPGSCGGCPSFDPRYLSHFNLVIIDTARCRSSGSSSEVECVLSPDGTASVAVEVTGSDLLKASPVAPLCVAIKGVGGWIERPVNMLPVAEAGSERLAFSLSAAVGSETGCALPAAAAGSTPCDQPTALYTGAAGIIDATTPVGLIPAASFERVATKLMVQLAVEPTSSVPGPPPYISLNGCKAPEAGHPMQSVMIADGVMSSQLFSVCGAQYGGGARLTGSVVGHTNVSAAVDIQGKRGLLTKQLDATQRVQVQYCDEEQPRLLLPDEVAHIESATAWSQPSSLDAVSLAAFKRCADTADDGGVEASCSSDATVVFKDGHRCQFSLGVAP